MDYKANDFDMVWQIKYVYRKFQNHGSEVPEKAYWKVFGSVANQGFDPLAFSKRAGDYPLGGTPKHHNNHRNQGGGNK
jgi:hypothetical protein